MPGGIFGKQIKGHSDNAVNEEADSVARIGAQTASQMPITDNPSHLAIKKSVLQAYQLLIAESWDGTVQIYSPWNKPGGFLKKIRFKDSLFRLVQPNIVSTATLNQPHFPVSQIFWDGASRGRSTRQTRYKTLGIKVTNAKSCPIEFSLPILTLGLTAYCITNLERWVTLKLTMKDLCTPFLKIASTEKTRLVITPAGRREASQGNKQETEERKKLYVGCWGQQMGGAFAFGRIVK